MQNWKKNFHRPRKETHYYEINGKKVYCTQEELEAVLSALQEAKDVKVVLENQEEKKSLDQASAEPV